MKNKNGLGSLICDNAYKPSCSKRNVFKETKNKNIPSSYSESDCESMNDDRDVDFVPEEISTDESAGLTPKFENLMKETETSWL